MKIRFVPCGTVDMIHIQSEEGVNILVDSGIDVFQLAFGYKEYGYVYSHHQSS